VYVSTAGNDSTCVRNDSSRPCLSLARAYQVAQAADLVEVAGGTYGDQSIGTGSDSKAVTFQPASGASVVTGALDVPASNVTVKGLTVRFQAGSPRTASLSTSGSHNTFDGVNIDSTMHQILGLSVSGNYDTFKNGSVGNVLDEKGALVAGNGSTFAIHTTFDHWDFHDVHASSSSVHAECLYNEGDYLTITGSHFWNCYVFDINFTLCCGNPHYGNATLINNVFERPISNDGNGYATYTIGINGSALGTFDNFTVVNNTFGSAVVDGPGISGSGVWANNIGQTWNCVPGFTYSHNVGGTVCAASDKSAASYGWVNSTSEPGDYHLTAGSPAIAAGDAAYAPATDRDGVTRTNPPDAGAYQH
jgi:hypothetical protein